MSLASEIRLIEVTVPKISLKWPLQCACCGGTAETRTTVKWQMPRPHGGYSLASHDIPACKNCALHRRIRLKGNWAMLFFLLGCMASLLISFGSYIFGFFSFLLWVSIQITITVKVLRWREERSTALIKPKCTRTNFVWVCAIANSQTFTFTNASYAKDFAELNEITTSKSRTVFGDSFDYDS